MNNKWEVLKNYFENDDGSLPEIHIKNIEDNEKRSVIQILLPFYERSKSHISAQVGYELPENLDDFITLAKNESLLIPLKNFNYNGLNIPICSFSSHGDDIELIYQMGELWNVNIFESLISFFKKVKSIAPKSSIELADSEGSFFDDDIAIFNKLISQLIK